MQMQMQMMVCYQPLCDHNGYVHGKRSHLKVAASGQEDYHCTKCPTLDCTRLKSLSPHAATQLLQHSVVGEHMLANQRTRLYTAHRSKAFHNMLQSSTYGMLSSTKACSCTSLEGIKWPLREQLLLQHSKYI